MSASANQERAALAQCLQVLMSHRATGLPVLPEWLEPTIAMAQAALSKRAAGQATEPVAWCVAWIRNHYQDHPNIASLCEAMERAAGQVIPEPVAAHIVQVGEQICHYTTCVRERCRAEERCLDAASLNQPSPLVKAEALALLDSAFEAEFDLLPEDAKQLCDTFFRGLRKRLGHPVECSGKSSGAVGGGTA